MALQFQVPQFVDIEDKIIGPLTIKQFLMFVVAFLILAALWVSGLPKAIAVMAGIPVIVFTGLLAFYKVNDRPFVWFLYAIVHFFLTGKQFLWERRSETEVVKLAPDEEPEEVKLKTAPGGARIEKLAQLLDTTGSVVGEDMNAPPGFEQE